MARTIQSPGIQFTETDFSQRAQLASPTTVFIAGFAPSGPASTPTYINSLGDFENIYGTPTNAAERYFYQTAKAVFQSTANVLTYRIPYGSDLGIGTSTQYSALVYPAVSLQNGVTATNFQYSTSAIATSGNVTYYFGAPTHVRLSQQQVIDIRRGAAFTWATDGGGVTSFTTVTGLGQAGLIVLNKSQASINNILEGTYLGVIDNTALRPISPAYNDFSGVYTVNTQDTFIGNQNYSGYSIVPTTRLDFTLSAATASVTKSISEVMENVNTFDISVSGFNDTINIGVFKLAKSRYTPDATTLGYTLQEGYTGSLDYYRKINSSQGGPAQSFFVGDITDTSKNIEVFVNPYISNQNVGTWLDNNGKPTKSVRFLNKNRLTDNIPLSTFAVYGGCSAAVYANLINAYGTTDKLVALGDYNSVDLTTKVIGNVPGKVSRLLDTIENTELYPLTIVAEAGLGTIYANSNTATTSGCFDDTVPYPNLIDAYTQDDNATPAKIILDYRAVADEFINFAANRRKDHLFIADPLTNIFVENNVKTLSNPTLNFSNNIYWPLRNQFSWLNNSYTAVYANCVQVADSSTNGLIWVPFSGFAASIMANVDSNAHPWYAPAGVTRGVVNGITDLAVYPKQSERDLLYKISLNPVVNLPNEGYVVFGQKTSLKQPSAFDRINVRRLFLTLEQQTNNTIRQFVFEPNTLFTRTQVVNTLAPIFTNAKNTNGLYDFLIVCDERNNPPAVIDDNTLVVDIYLKPTRTAEFILVNFYATRTDQNFAEITG